MTAKTHFAFSYLVLSALGISRDVSLVTSLVALLPDIDHTSSLLGRLFPTLSKWLMTRHGHRTLTHSCVFVIGLGVALLPLVFYYPVIYKAALFAYASHIFIDCFNMSGIRLFYPFSNREYISFKTEKLRVKVSSWKEITIFILLLFSCVMITGKSVSITGAAFSITKLFFRSYSVAYSSYRDMSDQQCSADVTWFNPLLRQKQQLTAPVLAMSQQRIIVKEGRARLVLNSKDVVKIKLNGTGTKLELTPITEIINVPYDENIFISGSITYTNYIPDIKPNDFIKTTVMPSSLKIEVSSITRSECVKLLSVGAKVEEEKDKLKKKLPAYQLKKLEGREASLEAQINSLSKKGLYDNYELIQKLTKQLKSVQGQKDRLIYQMDEESQTAVQSRLEQLQGFKIESDLYWVRVEFFNK